MQAINCAVLGAKGVGKTAFVTRTHQGWASHGEVSGEFCPEVKSVNTNQARKLSFHRLGGPSTKGPHNPGVEYVTFNVYEPTENKQDMKYDCAILLIEKAELKDPAVIIDAIANMKAVCGAVPFVVCGTKFDLPIMKHRSIDRELGKFLHQVLKVTYFDLSSKSLYNLEKPWTALARVMLQNPDLVL